MTEQEMEKIAEMVAIKLKGDENKMNSKEKSTNFKNYISTLKDKDELDNIINEDMKKKLNSYINSFKKYIPKEYSDYLKFKELSNGFSIEIEFEVKKFILKSNIDEIFIEDSVSTHYKYENYNLDEYKIVNQKRRTIYQSIEYWFENSKGEKVEIIDLIKEYLEDKYKANTKKIFV